MFVASKETVQKFISFIWETALKPRIFEKWWIADMDLSRINPKNESSEYITSVLRNDFEDSLISEKFLRGYAEIKLKSLDISQENKFLHNNKIVHRDLKSTNILLDGNDNAKLADFGLAKTWENLSLLQNNTDNLPKGTSRWMAPENIRGKFSKYSDIYSLGMVFWEICAKNTVPFSHFKNDVPVIFAVGSDYLII
jgi:serine/threonine protein kinase